MVNGNNNATSQPDACDKCNKRHGTLYQIESEMLCGGCVPFDYHARKNVFKLMRLAVTGSMNIQRRRNALERKAA